MQKDPLARHICAQLMSTSAGLCKPSAVGGRRGKGPGTSDVHTGKQPFQQCRAWEHRTKQIGFAPPPRPGRQQGDPHRCLGAGRRS